MVTSSVPKRNHTGTSRHGLMSGTISLVRQDDDSVSLDNGSNSSSHHDPIVVAYAFGPKKMKSMGVVMAEASRIPVIQEVDEDEFSFEDDQDEHVDTYTKETSSRIENSNKLEPIIQVRNQNLNTGDLVSVTGAHNDSKEEEARNNGEPLHHNNLTSAALARLESRLRGEDTIGTVSFGNSASTDLKNMVKFVQSTCSSTASLTETSVSTPNTLTSLNSKSTTPLSHLQISFVPLDLDIPLEEQHGGHFDLILHKLTEDILTCSLDQRSDQDQEESRSVSMKRIQALGRYQKEVNPRCCLVDDPASVQTVMSRSDIAQVLRSSLTGVKTRSGMPVKAPNFTVLGERRHDDDEGGDTSPVMHQLHNCGLSPPLMIKPLVAAGTKESHYMTILMSESGLQKLPPRCLIQEFVNHDAKLYKVYVLGQEVYVYERPSLPNLPCGDQLETEFDIIDFDSQRPYPRLEDFGIIDKGEHNRAPEAGTEPREQKKVIQVTSEEVRPVVESLRNAFGLELFGFDILLSADSNECLVVDVNYFPSYKEVPNFPGVLARYLSQRVLRQRRETMLNGY